MDEKYEVVISGIGGHFPECNSAEELKKNLFDKLNLVTVDDRRWPPGEMCVPSALGKVKEIHHFDTTFFGIHRRLSENLDHLTKVALERSYEAIVDAGFNPSELSGTHTAVAMASCVSESEYLHLFETKGSGFTVMGFNRSMQANRISYFLNLNGPSFSMDSSWIGGIQGLQIAYDFIAQGHCEGALVGIVNLALVPHTSVQYLSIGRLTYGTETKSFSNDADGYVRAEACVILYLQRKENARRSYGTILGVNLSSLGDKEVPLLENTTEGMKSFLEETYKKFNVDPSSLAYLEADGSGVKWQDAVELNAIEEVMCSNRKEPLLIGSIKSNLGHTEAASSFVSIVKALIALNEGVIPPNINYTTPNSDVPGLVSGKMKVVTEATPLPGDTVGVTTISLTGACAHVILKKFSKKKSDLKEVKSSSDNNIPRIFLASSRNNEGVVAVIDTVKNMVVDDEYLALTYRVFSKDIPGHTHRGYVILPPNEDPPEDLGNTLVVGGKQKPIWFIFSGMGSQWNRMGEDLLKLPIFAAAIEKCQKVLKPKGIDLYEILTTENSTIFDNILNSFVGIAAVQIGLVDILYALGIKPDGIIGHSVGELGCAYADGCFTAEQMILYAYYRGKASTETTLIKGMMAAVGLGNKQMGEENLPETIDIACHNSADSCTLSGPTEDMEKYINELKERKIFAKLVNVANIAYHSRYIKPAAPALLEGLKDVYLDPKPRSEKWICSSVPESEWNTELAKYSSAEYFTNNLLSPVLFEEASKFIPENAVTIEIAPHGLLQAILRRSLSKECINIPLTRRGEKDGVRFLLSAIGKMYMAGLSPDVSKLYPPVEFPVCCGTAHLHNLVHWDHTEKWRIGELERGVSPGERIVEISFNEEKHQLYFDHSMQNRLILPSSLYLVLIMETLMHMKKEINFIVPVIFENVKFLKSVEMHTRCKIISNSY